MRIDHECDAGVIFLKRRHRATFRPMKQVRSALKHERLSVLGQYLTFDYQAGIGVAGEEGFYHQRCIRPALYRAPVDRRVACENSQTPRPTIW